MQSKRKSLEVSLKQKKLAFDNAMTTDKSLFEVKEIYFEIKKLKSQLVELDKKWKLPTK